MLLNFSLLYIFREHCVYRPVVLLAASKNVTVGRYDKYILLATTSDIAPT